MAPELPWYPRLRRLVAPTDEAVRWGLGLIVLVTILLLVTGDAVLRAAWLLYLVSP